MGKDTEPSTHLHYTTGPIFSNKTKSKSLPTYEKRTVSAVPLTLVRFYSLTGGPDRPHGDAVVGFSFRVGDCIADHEFTAGLSLSSGCGSASSSSGRL